MVREKPERAKGGKPAGEVASITGLTTRDYMTINGTRYLIAPMDVYGLRKRAELTELTRRINELEVGAKASVIAKVPTDPADEREYEERIRELVAYALPAIPLKVAAKMTIGECQQVVGHFFLWLARTQTDQFEALRWIMRSSSLGLPASTALANGS